MPGIYVKEDEPFENALRRFKKQVQKSGVLTETKKRRAYEKPSVKKKRKAMAARKRLLKKLRSEVLRNGTMLFTTITRSFGE